MLRLYWVAAVVLALLPVGARAQCSPSNPTACGSTTLNTLTLGSQLNMGTWTTATRPTSPAVGATGFNNTTGLTETWNGTAWTSGGGNVTGPASSTVGYAATYANGAGSLLGAGWPIGTSGVSTIPLTQSNGLLSPAIIPPPSATTLGGVESVAPIAHQWITGISTAGVSSQAQPSAADVSGLGTFATQNYASPPAIGGTTPAAGAFTSLSASTQLTAPSLTSTPTAAGSVAYNTGSGRYDFGTGTGIVNHVRLSGDTMTGPLSAPSVNVTGTGGYQINFGGTTTNLARISQYNSSSAAPALFGGPGAGASAAAGTGFVTTWGAYDFESYSGSTANEGVAIGSGAGIASTTAGGNVDIGTSAGASETTSGGNVYICGYDCGRDAYTTANGPQISIGDISLQDGTFAGPNVVFGSNTLIGNAGIITIGSGYSSGDVLHLNITTTNACGTVNCTMINTTPVNYTLTSGDASSVVTLANNLASAWSAAGLITYILGDGVNESTHNLFQMQWSQTDSVGHPGVLTGHFPGSWDLSFTVTCTGTCGGTATVGGPFAGTNNIVVGTNSMNSAFITTASNNAIIGMESLQQATTAQGNSGIGYQLMPNATTAQYNSMNGLDALAACTSCQNNDVSGAFAGQDITSAQSNVLHGRNAGGKITTANGNVIEGVNSGDQITTGNGSNLILGNGVASTTLATGGYNVLVGSNSNCDTPSSSTSNEVMICGEAGPVMTFTGTQTLASASLALPFGGAWSANGSVATVLGSLGPTGSHTTVQEWFTVTDAGGNVRYVPGF